MSVAGISSNMIAPYPLGGSPNAANPTLGNNRQAEDNYAHTLIADLEKGDLSGAQQAYNALAAFGPNNSGPWAQGSQMQGEFQQLGKDLASGNLSGAKSDAHTLAANQLQHDMQAIKQNYKGDSAAFSQAVQNYKGDYWAIFGQMPNNGTPVQPNNGGAPMPPVGFSVTA